MQMDVRIRIRLSIFRRAGAAAREVQARLRSEKTPAAEMRSDRDVSPSLALSFESDRRPSTSRLNRDDRHFIEDVLLS